MRPRLIQPRRRGKCRAYPVIFPALPSLKLSAITECTRLDGTSAPVAVEARGEVELPEPGNHSAVGALKGSFMFHPSNIARMSTNIFTDPKAGSTWNIGHCSTAPHRGQPGAGRPALEGPTQARVMLYGRASTQKRKTESESKEVPQNKKKGKSQRENECH